MKVLITGGLGFIGLHLAKALVPVFEKVDLIDIRHASNLDQEAKNLLLESNVHYFQQDLLNLKDSLDNDYDYIFHFAALLGVENVETNPYKVLQQNISTTMEIINQAKKQKNLKKIFFTSTSEVYAGTLQFYGLNFPTKEDTPLTISPIELPRTSYMLSKIYGEGLFHASGVPFVILRPHNIYGPRMGMRHVIPQLLEKSYTSKDGGVLEVFSPLHTRTFCYISDAVHYIMKLLESDAVNVTLNLGTESPEITINELARMIIKTTEKSLQIKKMSYTVGSPSRRVPSTERLWKLTNYQPEISLDEGISRTYQWYKENHFKG